MKKFFIKTLGCKTNQLESEIIDNDLIKAGFISTAIPETSDLYIVNSCAVTQKATEESLYYLKNIKKKNNNIITVLSGCVAQLGEYKNCEFIDIVLGNNEKLSVSHYLQTKQAVNVCNIFDVKEFNNKFIDFYSKTRANLKIQDGCNNRCSYCTIPLARGNSRSNTTDNIVKQINIYTDNDIKEVVLTGIHIGQWGVDFNEKQKLIDLLKIIEKTNIKRYRLGSLDSLEADDELLNFLANSKKFCPHFHISIQSLDDNILYAMGRKYTVSETLTLIEKINKLFENPFIGCDIIVGFPGETEEMFLNCFNNLKKSNLSKIHVFPFSERKNTRAILLPNKIDDKIKKIRSDKLKELSLLKYNEFLNKNLNKILEVQIHKKMHKGYYRGTTRNYIDVLLNCDENISNKIVCAKIKEISGLTVYAEITSF